MSAAKRKNVKAQARYEVRQDIAGDVESTLVDSFETAKILKDVDGSYPEMTTLIVDLWTLPRTPEAYDAMVEQMAVAICADEGLAPVSRGFSRAALRAIGISRPKDSRNAAEPRITRPKDSPRNKETRK